MLVPNHSLAIALIVADRHLGKLWLRWGLGADVLDGLRDDALAWINFSPSAHPSEAMRMAELVPDPVVADAYLKFGLRPLGRMDFDPYDQPRGLDGPWIPESVDLSSEPILADTATGWRFRVEPGSFDLTFDTQGSDNYIEAQTLLFRAQHRKSHFKFRSHTIPAFCRSPSAEGLSFPIVKPIEIIANDRSELDHHVASLRDLFCGQLPVKRLWFRGQRREYLFPRDEALSTKLYGAPLPSLTPSLERYARANPEKMNFGFAWCGPNHWWKKPFLIWLMRQNAHWFNRNDRMLSYLAEILVDADDTRFAQLLLKIQMSPMEIGDPPHLPWPDEVDDLRQWFFAFMKSKEFAITLQQYGYYTSLLDLTDDIDVALYFSQASMVDRVMRCAGPQPGRVIYVFAESRGQFFHHGYELFWGTDGWVNEQPPRLGQQRAGFIKGATNRTQNFYGLMIVARISLGPDGPVTCLADTELFPSEENDLLFQTLKASRPELEGLY